MYSFIIYKLYDSIYFTESNINDDEMFVILKMHHNVVILIVLVQILI